MDLTPWWQALKIREEIVSGSGQIDDVQMSLFQAAYGTGKSRPLYADASYYGDITHPTERLVSLLSEVAIRLGGGSEYQKARAVTRLDQGMGGGKSHACIGAFHLASNPTSLRQTDLGTQLWAEVRRTLGKELPADLDGPHVVVLACDNMTPGAPVKEHDGPAETLYERFLWRLFSRDYALFERYQPYYNDKSKIVEALTAINRPVLIVIDEIMDYVGHGLDASGKPDLAAADMGFLRALLDAANEVPNVALLVVMIASDRMALSEAGEKRRDELNDLLVRNGTPATVTEAGDFAAILRRRLFDRMAPAELVGATAQAFAPVFKDKAWAKGVWDALGSAWLSSWEEEVSRCYPFHPMLVALAQEEWSKVTGFQRVRSTIRIFAATVYALQERGRAGEWAPLLIGPGDLPLGENNVREAVLGSGLVEDERTISNYRSLAEIEITNEEASSGVARRQDLEREALLWRDSNPRAAERAATFLFLASIVGNLRPGARRGASNPELKAATSVPSANYTLTDSDEVVEDLMNPDRGLTAVEVIPGQGNNKPARYFLSTRLTHRMLVNNLRRTVTDADRDQVLAEAAERLANSGPFRQVQFIKADLDRSPVEVLSTSGVDNARTSRLYVLDPSQFSLRNGIEIDTIEALQVIMGLGEGDQRIPIEWASSAVYAVVNTQRRALARNVATEYVARERALQAPEVQADEDLKSTGTRELAEARDKLERAVKRAFQHVAYLAQPDPDLERRLEVVTFDDENQTSLDGTQVWKALVSSEKAFDSGQFTARALVHNLRASDYGRPLAEIRDSFFNTPRLPLLHSGERDLQQAIHEAVQEGLINVTDGDGTPVAVTQAGQVNLGSTTLRLSLPEPESVDTDGEGTGSVGSTSGGRGDTTSQGGDGPGSSGGDSQQPTEKFLTFPLVGSLLEAGDKADALASLFLALYQAVDEQKASYAAGTLQFVLDAEVAERIAQQARNLGLHVTIRDQ